MRLGIAAEITTIPNRCGFQTASGLDFKSLVIWTSEIRCKFFQVGDAQEPRKRLVFFPTTLCVK